jgi:uncharacterized membrane protein YqjE
MESSCNSIGQLVETARRLARRLLTIGENRLELLVAEVQEERARLLHAILLALGVVAFGLLAGIALTAAIAVVLWPYSPVAVLLTLAGLYAAAAAGFYWRLTALLRNRKALSATLEQLRQDRGCLERQDT